MKGYLVRMTPLICENGQAAFLRHSAMFAGLSTKLCRVGASSWVVETQVVAPVPQWLYGRGLTWRFRQQKRHLVFAPRCLTCYTERIQLEL